jgi:hypothetical protein
LKFKILYYLSLAFYKSEFGSGELKSFAQFQTSWTTLNTLMTPSPPPQANMSPPLLKSTLKQALLKFLTYAQGLNMLFPSKILTSLAPLPPATIKSPEDFWNWAPYIKQGLSDGRPSSHGKLSSIGSQVPKSHN